MPVVDAATDNSTTRATTHHLTPRNEQKTLKHQTACLGWWMIKAAPALHSSELGDGA